MAVTRQWFRYAASTGEVADYRFSGGPHLINGSLGAGAHITVLRTRLMAQAWWGDEVFQQPSLAAQHFPLRAMVAFNGAESGDYPPPPDWPDPDGSGSGHFQPTINDPLTLTALWRVPADPVGMTPQVIQQAAQLVQPAGDSHGMRRFSDRYVITAWVDISQHDPSGSPGASPFPFYASYWLDVLAEYGV